ncbi:MAG: hypothetical protein H6718_21410 [Polyangiaceae bacterium]|nr:hypothetical protein [Myxococcales bacterium]MCB9587978.1 hypothetical protein [Polyangiaceae bacterium]
MRRWSSLFVLVLCAAGCSSSSTNQTTKECSGGEIKSCEHSTGCVAEKACDGMVFGECLCVNSGGAGGTSSGGSGGSNAGGSNAGGSNAGSNAGGSGGTSGVAGSGGTGGTAGAPTCTSEQKLCDGKCEALDDPNKGCGGLSCDPCPHGNGTAVCETDGACGVACGTDALLCDGACVSSKSDAKNCGYCGHDCGPGACLMGACQPFTVATPKDPLGIAADGTDVYWANGEGGAIERAPRGTTGSATSVATGLTNPKDLVLVGDEVVFIEETASGRVGKVAKIGGNITDVAAGLTPTQLTGDSAGLFWTTSASIFNGTDSRGAKNAQGMTLDGTHVYFSEAFNGALVRMPRDLASAESKLTLTTSQVNPTAVAVDDTQLYWTARDASGGVFSIPKSGGAIRTLDSGGEPWDVEVDATHIYWLSRLPVGQLKRAPLSGSPVESVADTPGNVHSLVVTSDALYWTVQGSGGSNGRVLGVMKP